MSLCCSSIYVCQQDLTRFLYFDTETLISFLFYKWYQTKILCQRWMNICRLRYELLVSPQLNSLPILISYTQGTVLHWNRRDLLTLSILFMGFLSSLSQLLHSKKKKNLGLKVALIGTLLVQAPVFGIKDQTIQWMDLKALVMHLRESARQNTTIGSIFCNPLYSSLRDQMPCMFVSMKASGIPCDRLCTEGDSHV